jgi:hypothetical protein
MLGVVSGASKKKIRHVSLCRFQNTPSTLRNILDKSGDATEDLR